ncbi:unnamed protein product [Euphydryas editha]|uniref:SHSP domain-containing protein n=1 Tax=Euphydryas editha TaxID=104508 RepID=A0AAU9UVK7_EUPED|nr:unnamed protein product [Euphydryas editha]
MIAFVLLAIVACASAAPHFHHYRSHQPYYQGPYHHGPYNYDNNLSLERFMDSQVFDTRAFWEELTREMMGLEAMIADLYKHFPNSLSEEKVEGNEYKINIPLSGFDEKEIAVKAKKGLLIVQAVRQVSDEPARSFLGVRTLPDDVNVNGSWTYTNGLLRIVFPLERKSVGEPTVTEIPVTQAPESVHSPEVFEIDNRPSDSQDADVGIASVDTDKENTISTNEIQQGQTVEATTYAVDLKGDVELVPIKYY